MAALLELARLLGAQPALPYRIDLVAYTLGEPAYFQTSQMDSYVHAASLKANGTPVRGVVALEMRGHCGDRRGSRYYPVWPLMFAYGSRGFKVTGAQKFNNGRFGRRFVRGYRAGAHLPVRRFRAPA